MKWVFTFILISPLRIYDCFVAKRYNPVVVLRCDWGPFAAISKKQGFHEYTKGHSELSSSTMRHSSLLHGCGKDDKSMGINGETDTLETASTRKPDVSCNIFHNSSIIEGSFGDIMSNYAKDKRTSSMWKANLILQDTFNVSSIPISGLVTDSGGTLQRSFGPKAQGYLTPLERIALTANGNLQRIFSSYYDAPVHILVQRCERQQQKQQQHDEAAVWHRQVLLTVHSQIFCTASSIITVQDPRCIQLVETGKVGIGQLFRHLDKLPSFELLDVGRSHEGGIWRQYCLSCRELTCHITETFEPDAWMIQPPPPEPEDTSTRADFLGKHDLSF
jgi:chorismate-pyruvate lyase